MKHLLLLVFMVTLFVHHVQPANILVLAFFSSKSHKLTYLPLIEELGKRGHNITMVTPVKPTKKMENVKEIFTMDIDHVFTSVNVIDSEDSGKGPNPLEIIKTILEVGQASYELPQIQALLDEKFDLIFVQPLSNEIAFGLIHKLNAPYVLFTPVSIPTFVGDKVGAHFPPSITPNFMLDYSQEMTFYQRFINFGLNTVMDAAVAYFYYPEAERIYREKLGEDVPSIKEIFANASLVLSNGHFSVSGGKPFFPDVVDVGGIHSKPAKPIPKDLEDFIQKGKDGFILFSMGSVVKGDMMSDAKRKMILNVFSKLKQQVLWKWESETMNSSISENVKLSKWLPQQDLLGHKDIKMFITHCGGGGTEEAIYHGVPLIGMPLIADQIGNAALAKRKGILIELNWNELTEENLENAITEILKNSEYRDKAKKLSTLFKDRPQDPLDLGVYWIEYVLRHKGAPHLRNAGRKMNTFQYHSVDVIGAYLAVLATALYLIYLILWFVIRKMFSCFLSSNHNKLDMGKKVK